MVVEADSHSSDFVAVAGHLVDLVERESPYLDVSRLTLLTDAGKKEFARLHNLYLREFVAGFHGLVIVRSSSIYFCVFTNGK